MSPLAGPVWAALALLVVAGAPKVLRPYDTMRALRKAGLRVPAFAIRIGGAAEAVLGVAALASGNRVLLALAAVSYLGFAGFVVHALRSDSPLASCGCFGKADTPPTRLHLAIVAFLAFCLAVTAITGGTGLFAGDRLSLTLTTAGFAAILCWFCYLAMAVLPRSLTRPRNPGEVTRIPTHPHTTGGTR